VETNVQLLKEAAEKNINIIKKTYFF
jgi:hypothetical protein